MIWNPFGFQVVDKLPTGTKMNSDYFMTNILGPLEQKIFPNGKKPHAKRLTVRLENCLIHTGGASEVFMAEHNTIWLKHLPDSPISRLVIFTCSQQSKKTSRYSDGREEELFYRLRELLNEIPIRELRKVFDTWIKSLPAVTPGMGATYLEE
jgi:hypothetical protein